MLRSSNDGSQGSTPVSMLVWQHTTHLTLSECRAGRKWARAHFPARQRLRAGSFPPARSIDGSEAGEAGEGPVPQLPAATAGGDDAAGPPDLREAKWGPRGTGTWGESVSKWFSL